VSNSIHRTITIRNRLGLHARPATMFVETAMRFNAGIRVRRSDRTNDCDGKSIMQLLILAATQGTELELVAEGPDAEEALDALSALAEAQFREDD